MQSSAAAHGAFVRQNSAMLNPPASHKLHQAAAEFESILLASLWKSMKGSFASPDEESSDPAHETLDDLGVQSMCAAVGKAGGLGLGRLILKHLEPQVSDGFIQNPKPVYGTSR
jgi:Rod binding domain-containing protein